MNISNERKYMKREEFWEKFGDEICEHCFHYNMGKRHNPKDCCNKLCDKSENEVAMQLRINITD